MFQNLAIVYPEAKRYILRNLLSSDVTIVTEQMLRNAFSEQDIVLLFTNRHNNFALEDF